MQISRAYRRLGSFSKNEGGCKQDSLKLIISLTQESNPRIANHQTRVWI